MARITKRGSCYYFRVKVPKDVLPAGELKGSLRCTDEKTTAKLARLLGHRMDRVFDRARAIGGAAAFY